MYNMEMLYFSKDRLAYLFKCSVDALETKISEYLEKNPLKINIDHYLMLPHIDNLSVQLRGLGVRVNPCNDIDLNLLILGKTVGGIYVPNNKISIKNILKSKIVYGFKEEFVDVLK